MGKRLFKQSTKLFELKSKGHYTPSTIQVPELLLLSTWFICFVLKKLTHQKLRKERFAQMKRNGLPKKWSNTPPSYPAN